MTIKDMEKEVGITKANIRFYEKEGLISPARGSNNYREYTDEDKKALEKIKYLRLLGISVSDIRLFIEGKRPLFFSLGCVLSMVFFPVNSILRIPVSGNVIEIWTTFALFSPFPYWIVRTVNAGCNTNEAEKPL